MLKLTKVLEKKDHTEQIIKETAKKIFFKEGKFNATTQEIADAAGVNRTLINYYFRSRNNLFKIVFEEAKRMEQVKSEAVLNSSVDFKSKIAQFIDLSLEMNVEYPYLETYIVSQINQGSIYKRDFVDEAQKEFFKQVEKEMQEGRIEEMEPVQFLLNMVSLVNFPIAVRPLIQENLSISDQEYRRLLSERKAIILKTLFKN